MSNSAESASEDFLNVADVLDRMARLHDDVPLKADEAAVYLRVHPSSLERWRKNGTGPKYIQGGGRGAKGTNQKVSYRMGELRAWQRRHEVGSSMDAAIFRGQALVAKDDVFQKVPFWNSNGIIIGRVYDDAPERYIKNRELFEIEWLSSGEALSRDWLDSESHKKLAQACKRALKSELYNLDVQPD